MSSTFLSLHYHLVFSTKNRAPSITTDWRTDLHNYLGGTINGLGGQTEIVGGVEDHAHLLFGLKATHCLADVVRELKKASCNWARDDKNQVSFYWQNGYAAFTVSPTSRDSVANYIAHQESHHRRKSFRDELKELLIRAGVDFHEQFLD